MRATRWRMTKAARVHRWPSTLHQQTPQRKSNEDITTPVQRSLSAPFRKQPPLPKDAQVAARRHARHARFSDVSCLLHRKRLFKFKRTKEGSNANDHRGRDNTATSVSRGFSGAPRDSRRHAIPDYPARREPGGQKCTVGCLIRQYGSRSTPVASSQLISEPSNRPHTSLTASPPSAQNQQYTPLSPLHLRTLQPGRHPPSALSLDQQPPPAPSPPLQRRQPLPPPARPPFHAISLSPPLTTPRLTDPRNSARQPPRATTSRTIQTDH